MRRVVVTGLGAVTPLGVGTSQSWKRILDGASGIVSLSSRPGFETLSSKVAATVPVEDGGDKEAWVPWKWRAEKWLSGTNIRQMAQFSQYAVVAAEEALMDARWVDRSAEEKERTGVCIGSGIGSFEDAYNTSIAWRDGGFKKVSPLFVPRLLINMAAGHVTMKFGFNGPNHAASTACTTGAHAIGDASRFIQFGDADVMLAGGAESCIHPLAMAGFARAKSLSTHYNDEPERASRPFDKGRDGFVIGEGAGVLVLEELEHARKRGAKIYAEVLGYGVSADAHHLTAPPEDGRGAFLAMKRSLIQAGIKPKEVDYVNAHATSTPLGDAAENRAIKTLLLGEDGHVSAKNVTISSSKGQIGHLLGAAGAVEAIFTIKAVHENIVPPTANLTDLEDTETEFSCNYVPIEPQEKQVDVAICNSFGFGGTNASICFRKYVE